MKTTIWTVLKPGVMITTGVVLALISLWCGSYFLWLYNETWLGFPIFMTAMTGFIVGIILAQLSVK
jgi:hypothetical protein